ncbi:non-homologous end joining protein Ku [Curtobacterium ammoniigenes]|uniref:non-homologous end joining protein Ku n=1 Tax=Curtobacterium ammoniigenes TaxID=395387 RepID=UPI000832EF10|nr:Ku protein [Curtobacterium ammoniigenes]
MRSIWKGSIAFGLVNVPIKVYAATETHDVSLHQVHAEDKGRIRYKRVCEFGHEVDYGDIQRAYDDGEKTVILTPDDFKQLPEEQSHEIEVLEFVPTEQVDPMLFEKSYYLEPDSRSPKAYVLLRETLERTDRTAIVQFTLRQKTRLGALRVHGDVLLLQGLLWSDEVREADFPALGGDTKVSANELKMSSSLVESMSSDFEPDKYTDEYQVELQQLIDAKLEAGDDVDTAQTFGERAEGSADDGGDVIDLMAALRASVDRKRAKSSGSSSSRSGGSARADSADDSGDSDNSAADASSGGKKSASRSSGGRASGSRSAGSTAAGAGPSDTKKSSARGGSKARAKSSDAADAKPRTAKSRSRAS